MEFPISSAIFASSERVVFPSIIFLPMPDLNEEYLSSIKESILPSSIISLLYKAQLLVSVKQGDLYFCFNFYIETKNQSEGNFAWIFAQFFYPIFLADFHHT